MSAILKITNMNIKNFLTPLFFAGAFLTSCKEEPPLWDFGTYNYFSDIEFDSTVFNYVITPESDTLYVGFHRRCDSVPGYELNLYETFTIARWSTAKCNRDFMIPAMDSNSYTNAFRIMCEPPATKGNFMIVVRPEKINEPMYVKLYKYNMIPELSYSKQECDTLTINFIPQKEQL